MGPWALVAKVAAPILRWTRGRLLERRPLTVTFIDEPLDYMRAWVVVTPARVRDPVPRGLTMSELREWLVTEHQAVAAGQGFATMVLTSRAKVPVRLVGLRAEVVERQSAFIGSSIRYPPAGASDVEGVFFDLDSPDKEALADAWPDDQPPSRGYPRTRQVQLLPGESLTFGVRVATADAYCRWRPVVTAEVRGRSVTLRPALALEVSGTGSTTERLQWEWWEQPPRLGPDDEP